MTKDQLIASLAAVDNTSYNLPATDYYLDWSSRDDDVIYLEVGDGTSDGTAQIPMTREDLISLQQRLTAYLIATA